MKMLIDMIERGFVPTPLVRFGIQKLLGHRIRMEDAGSEEARRRRLEDWVKELRRSPIALCPEQANRQHYEVPPDFFERILGPHLKYSGCYWSPGTRSLAEAETAMLRLTCQRAQLQDGMEILELGCGWGSLTLWMAERYPNSRILAMSNSSSQREFVTNRAHERGLSNVRVLTADINDFHTNECFDRVVSVEMLEHVRNYQKLFSRLARWLKSDGRLFVHVFCHRYLSYPFESEGTTNWMGRYFFTGGLMPSAHLFSHFQDDLQVEKQWWIEGTHYAKTASAWLENLNRRELEILPVFRRIYGTENRRWFTRWKLFFMACEELFGHQGGHAWGVSHYRFSPMQ